MIKITVTQTDKKTKEVVSTLVREFTKDKESIQFLKDVDNFKMQQLLDNYTLNSGLPQRMFKPTDILKNPKSSYGFNMLDKNRHAYFQLRVTQPKPLFKELAKGVTIETNIKIEHV